MARVKRRGPTLAQSFSDPTPKKSKGKRTPPDPDPVDPTGPEDIPVEPGEQRLAELRAKLHAAEDEHMRLLDTPEPGNAYQRDVALVESKAWRLRGLIHHELGQYDDARKASSTAQELALLAVKLEQASLVDRVAVLEARIERTQQATNVLAGLEEKE